MSLDLLIGLLLGLSISAAVFPLTIRLYMRNKIRLRKLISEMYHKDLLPEICRVEGMLSLYEIENKENQEMKDLYISIAKKAILRHKKHVSDLIKEYEPFQ